MGKYWEEEEKKVYKICEEEGETWEHVWEEYGRQGEVIGGWQENVGAGG